MLINPLSSFRDVLSEGLQSPEMVMLPAGRFLMGDITGVGEESEQPVHEVIIAQPFAIGKYPVTFAEYDLFCEATERNKPSDEGWGRDRQPVINVTWKDAIAYCHWLSGQTGKAYCLPSEAQWEYACRAGTQGDYYFGDDASQLSDYAWFYDNAAGQTHAVGQKQPNAWGLHDMHGNVWEWCQDVWHDDYTDAPTDGSAWKQGGNQRVRIVRGSAWFGISDALRSAARDWYCAASWYGVRGFRVLRKNLE